MSWFDRFAWWGSKPENCDKILFAFFGAAAAVWFFTGDWSPLP